MGGMVLETNMNEIITQVDAQNKMEKSEVRPALPSSLCTEVLCRMRACVYAAPCMLLSVTLRMLPTLRCLCSYVRPLLSLRRFSRRRPIQYFTHTPLSPSSPLSLLCKHNVQIMLSAFPEFVINLPLNLTSCNENMRDENVFIRRPRWSVHFLNVFSSIWKPVSLLRYVLYARTKLFLPYSFCYSSWKAFIHLVEGLN